MEKDDEVKGSGNSYTTEFRQYDARLGKWLSVDPLFKDYPWQSPYVGLDNNPIILTDPKGLGTDEWVEKDGQMSYDNRVTNQEDATALYGEGAIYRPNGYTYTSSDGSNIELGDYGFFKQNGQIKSSPDLAEKSLAYTEPELAMVQAQSEIFKIRGSYQASVGIIGFISTDIAVPEPSDAAWPKWAGYAVVGGVAAYYVAKMEREIEGITRRAGGPMGVQYSLRATTTGSYPCYTCLFSGGSKNLVVGEVWKFGETTQSSRYTDTYLRTTRVSFVPEFYGNQVQIKVVEKMKIYNYFLQNGHLPPGNKIFR